MMATATACLFALWIQFTDEITQMIREHPESLSWSINSSPSTKPEVNTRNHNSKPLEPSLRQTSLHSHILLL
jgi:hypothetical protein